MSNILDHVRLSAEQGNATAQFNLGILCGNGLDDNGRAVVGNRTESMGWLRKAANQGLSRAQCKLAEIYAEGDKPSDSETACAWFLVAMDNADGGGRQGAHDGFEKIVKFLSAEQIDRAKGKAAVWTAKIQKECDKRDREINTRLALRG